MIRYCVIIAALCLSSCGEPPGAVTSPEANNSDAVVEPAPKPRFSQAALAKARKGVEAEPLVVDYLLDPERAVELTVAIWSKGGREYGYAEYYCMMLRDWGVYDDDMDVRIIDARRLAQSGGDWQSISLGTVRCRDGSRWD